MKYHHLGHIPNIPLLTRLSPVPEYNSLIIDEWDCLFREDKNNENLQKEYINLLRGLFKGAKSIAIYVIKDSYVSVRDQ